MHQELLGYITWKLLHVLNEKIRPEGFTIIKNDLINITNSICINYSSKIKSQLFNIFFKNVNFGAIDKQFKFKNLYILFHNFVNKKINKPVVDIIEYTNKTFYCNASIFDIINYYNGLNNNQNIAAIIHNFVNKYSNFIISHNFLKVESIITEIEPTIKEEVKVNDEEKEKENISLIIREMEPIVKEEEPIVQVEEPIIQVEEPIVQVEEPNVQVEEPIVKEEEPIVKEEEPNVKEEEPNVKEMVRIIELRKKYNMYSNISIIDDKKLPSLDISLSDAMLEINARKLEPFNVYIERWTTLHDKKHKVSKKKSDEPIINDLLLPELTLSFPIALSKIRANPKCIPEELYIKRWNELKTLKMYKRDKK